MMQQHLFDLSHLYVTYVIIYRLKLHQTISRAGPQ